MIGIFIMKLFHARTVAHVLHLKTRQLSVHLALNTFYDEIIPLADSLAEAYQGEHGLIGEFPPKFEMCSDPLELTESLLDWIAEHRTEIGDPDDTHLQNIIDEIVALTNSTQYKLKFLK